jgi:GT2 family glycosyltransferase
MNSKTPLVAIIILNWNGLKDTLECLESVHRQEYPNFDVIVVDNASTDNSVQGIRHAWPEVVLLENRENIGYTGGNNVGMHYAVDCGADYVWLLNNDTTVSPDALSRLVAKGEKEPDVGLVSPAVYYYEDPARVQFRGGLVDEENYRLVLVKDDEDCEAILGSRADDVWLTGTALLVKRQVIDRIGYLRAGLFAYWEDVDYSLRSSRCGSFRNVMEPTASIYHKGPLPESMQSQRPPHYFYYMTRNKFYFWISHLRWTKRLSFLRHYVSDTIGDAVPLRNRQAEENMNACLDGMWAGLTGIIGPWKKDRRMPRFLKRVLLWHPYLLINCLRGDFAKVLSESKRRCGL